MPPPATGLSSGGTAAIGQHTSTPRLLSAASAAGDRLTPRHRVTVEQSFAVPCQRGVDVTHSSCSDMARTCIFCGARANSLEDAIPRWLVEHHAHLHGSGQVARRWGALDDPQRIRRGTWDGLAVQVRSVCRRCNNGWLSELESETTWLIKPMLSGLAVELHDAQQRTLAFWAVKTAVTMQEANRSIGLPIPAQQIEALSRAHATRPRVLSNQLMVWLARHRGPSVGFSYLVCFTTSSPGTFTPRDSTQQHRYWIGLRVGNVAFHILGHAMDPANVRVTANPHALLRLWPPATPITIWPPLVSFEDGQFDAMARTALPRANWHRAGIVVPAAALAGSQP